MTRIVSSARRGSEVLLFNTITRSISCRLPVKRGSNRTLKTYSFELGRPTMATTLDNQFKNDVDRRVRRRNKVLSTKVPGDLHNRFSLLAEYLFDSGLSENFTPSAL